jgi:CheY-like chemotaxis protein/HD-like signal output (HDOD) protein
MGLIMVVDDAALVREAIAAILRHAGYETTCAVDGSEALELLKRTIPNLILLDLMMPRLDGLGLLRVLRKRPDTANTPVILLTATADKDKVVAASKFGVRDCIVKSKFSLSELLSRVGRYVPLTKSNPSQISSPKPLAKTQTLPPAVALQPVPSASPKAAAPIARGETPRLLDREQCLKRAEQAMQARTLSGVVAQVISLATSPRSDLSDLSTLIARDPMLSARVLQAANSVSYTSTRGMVSTLPEAVRNIGCSTIRDIAASLGVFDAMPPSEADGFNPIRSWQHSFAVATLCNRLAPERDGGSAYLIGLCHDLGEILFHSHFGAEYHQVLEAQQTTGKRRDELERQMLGVTHGELVQTILCCMALPDEIRRPIALFHEAGLSRAAAEPLARLLQVADLYATGTQLAASEHSPLRPITRPECRQAIGKDDPETPDAVPLRGEIYALTAMLARLSAKEEAMFMTPPYAHKPIRVMLVRDPSLSPFDPVAAALESLADVTIRSSLPAAADLAGHERLVVVARSTSASGFTDADIRKATAVADSPPSVLWLTGRIDGTSDASGEQLTPVLWPVPLSHLADFVHRD